MAISKDLAISKDDFRQKAIDAYNRYSRGTPFTTEDRVLFAYIGQVVNELWKEHDRLDSYVEDKVEEFYDQVRCSTMSSIAEEAVEGYMDYFDFDNVITNWMNNNFSPSDWDLVTDNVFDEIKSDIESNSAGNDELRQSYKELWTMHSNFSSETETRLQELENELALLRRQQKEHNTVNNCVLQVTTSKERMNVNFLYMQIEGKIWCLREEVMPGGAIIHKIFPARQVLKYEITE